MSLELPKIPSLALIQTRLPLIFPEGSENRNYLIRDISAKTIFVMFYTGAIEGTERWIRPDQVTKMTDRQAKKIDDKSRLEWTKVSLSPGKMKYIPDRWYAVNTREPIRDETLRIGLIMVNAVVERQGLPTTSPKPRYALSSDFTKLFDEEMDEQEFEKATRNWRETYLSSTALARIRLRNRGAFAAQRTSHILVRLPNGETRRMEPGPSSVLTKAVIEDFTKRFLKEPALIFLSESGNKIVAQDYELARSIGLDIKADRNLPDIILADIGLTEPIIVFVEVVVTDGAITRSRKESLLKIALDAGFPSNRIFFVSAFEDRGLPVFRRLSSDLVWGSLVWFASEPDYILVLLNKQIILDSLDSIM